MAEADCEPSLFGWQAMDAKARAVVLCEGDRLYDLLATGH
jgi:twinkle protein